MDAATLSLVLQGVGGVLGANITGALTRGGGGLIGRTVIGAAAGLGAGYAAGNFEAVGAIAATWQSLIAGENGPRLAELITGAAGGGLVGLITGLAIRPRE